MKRFRMMKRSPAGAFLPAVALLAGGLLACGILSCGPVTDSPPGLAGPCTETGNPTGIRSIAGKVLDAAGKPVANAKVKLLIRTGPDTSGIAAASAQTTTCPDGSYGFRSLPASTYALEASDTSAGTVAWFPKVVLAETSGTGGKTLPTDLVLKQPGAVSGSVTRGPYPAIPGIVHEENILVRLIHTDRSLYTDTSGLYLLGPIPEGVYRAVFAAVDGHFLTAYADSVRVEAGKTTVLPRVQLVWSPNVAPPTPSRLSVRPDTGGLVRLGWHALPVGNFDHYEIERSDSLVAVPLDTLLSKDTAYVDSIKGIAAGHILTYRIRTVNALLNHGDWSSSDTARVPMGNLPDTGGRAVSALVRKGGLPAAAVRVSLYRIPVGPGSPDSLPLMPKPVDSALTGADGRVRFDSLPAGAYALEAWQSASGLRAFRRDAHASMPPQAGLPAPDTLDLLAAGTIRGTASRQKAWVTDPGKGNFGIQFSLAGTPYVAHTDFSPDNGDSGYTLKGVPAGVYQAVLYALPKGFFLPDTQSVTVYPGDTATLPYVAVTYNPKAPLLKPGGLRIDAFAGGKVTLKWSPIAAGNQTVFFKGYVVVRMSESGALTQSLPTKDSFYLDNLAGIPSGAILRYMVHVENTDGKTGLNAGDDQGQPVLFTLP